MSSPIHPVAAEPMLDYGESPLLKRKNIHFSLTGGNDKVLPSLAKYMVARTDENSYPWPSSSSPHHRAHHSSLRTPFVDHR